MKAHLDCYGSLADTSVAEDGYLKEHSYWGTLCGMKMSASFHFMVWMRRKHRANERERTRLTILDYGEKNGRNSMTVEKQGNGCNVGV